MCVNIINILMNTCSKPSALCNRLASMQFFFVFFFLQWNALAIFGTSVHANVANFFGVSVCSSVLLSDCNNFPLSIDWAWINTFCAYTLVRWILYLNGMCLVWCNKMKIQEFCSIPTALSYSYNHYEDTSQWLHSLGVLVLYLDPINSF